MSIWTWDFWDNLSKYEFHCQCCMCGCDRQCMYYTTLTSMGEDKFSLHHVYSEYHFTYLILPSCHFSGASSLLDISSKPTQDELDKLIVSNCREWEQAALHLGVQSHVLETEKWDNPGKPEEACRGVLHRWLLCAPGTGETERTWHSVLESLETSGHSQLVEQLKSEQFAKCSEEAISPFLQPVTSVGESCKSFLSSIKPLWLVSPTSFFKSPFWRAESGLVAWVKRCIWHCRMLAFQPIITHSCWEIW